mgnify:CR=1 FL=1
MSSISQTNISNNSFVDISVVSTTLSLLEKKKNLQNIHFNNLQICKNCLLVSRKIEKNFW